MKKFGELAKSALGGLAKKGARHLDALRYGAILVRSIPSKHRSWLLSLLIVAWMMGNIFSVDFNPVVHWPQSYQSSPQLVSHPHSS